MIEKNLNAGKRLASMVLDHIFMTMICILFFIPMMIGTFSGAFVTSHEQNGPAGFSGPTFYIGLFGFALYFCKDCFSGRSIAKRILKLQVVDIKTGQVASPLKCFVRNIFCIIWPIEIIVVLINPSRRIGDQVAGTEVVYYEPSLIEQPKANTGKILISIILAFGLTLLLMVLFQAVKPSYTKIKYVKNSYNETQSKTLEKLYSDSLGQYLTASVRIYDSIENQKIKYISIIYRLKENYLADANSAENLKIETMYFLYRTIPKNEFTGQAQYVYQAKGNMQNSTLLIGTKPADNK